ncbi:hypothetical protein H9P43_000331 [Blastocladiella emersonii ATCC 22665]|nr:hypothetical protein H9P43_000331 [Blastocladiella emersonii ATCC 22665]
MDLTRDFWLCASAAAAPSIPVPPIPSPDGSSASTATPATPAGLRRRGSVAVDAAHVIPTVTRRHSRAGPAMMLGRRSSTASSLGAATGPVAAAVAASRAKQAPRDPFLAEAEAIMTDICALASFLHASRRAYLGIVSSSTPATAATATAIPRSVSVMGFTLDVSSVPLTVAEREQFDQQMALLLGQARKRVRALEATVERERALVQRDASGGKEGGLFARFLPASSEAAVNEAQAARAAHAQAMLTHYASVAWILNQHLLRVSSEQRRIQEKRMGLDLDRLTIDTPVVTKPAAPRGGVPGGFDAMATLLNTLNGTETASTTTAASAAAPDPSPDASSNLPAGLLQELEAENQSLLAQFESKLDEVRAAETSLLAVAQLQTELAQQMAVQASQIEALADDAVVHTDNVRAGNVQLAAARELGKGSRFWFLFMMLVLSASLLFLDWYAG